MKLMRGYSMVMLCWCLSLGAEDIPRVPGVPREIVVVSWNVLADANERDRRLPVLLRLRALLFNSVFSDSSSIQNQRLSFIR